MKEKIKLPWNRIHDPMDPRLVEFGERKDALVKQRGQIIVDSDKVVTRMINGGFAPKKLLATERFLRQVEEESLHLPPDSETFWGDKPVLESIVGHRLHHGVVAIGDRPEDTPLDALGDRLVVLNGVGSAENVGAIARSCHAFGFTGLIADDIACTPWVRRSIRVSMGSVFSLKVHHCGPSKNLVEELRDLGYAIYGTGIVPGSLPSKGFKPAKKFALIFGSEGTGMEQEVIASTDAMLRIPVHEGIDSLNVAVASGILLYELGRLPG